MHQPRNHPLEIVGAEFEAFFRSLRIPPAGPEIAAAAAALKEAKEVRAAAQAKHAEAGKRLSSQKLGEAPDVTHSDLDELGAQIAPAIAAEKAAQAEYDRVVSQYRAAADVALQVPLERYHDALNAKIEELAMLLSIGAVLHTESTATKVKLTSKVPSFCPHIMTYITGMRSLLGASKR